MPRASAKQAQAIQEARKGLSDGHPERAAKVLEALLRKRKPGAEVLFLMGAAHEAMGRLSQAEAFARRSLAQFKHPDTQMLLARCLRVKGDTDNCVTLCDKVLARLPDSEAANVMKGGALEEAGRYDEARDCIGPLVRRAEQEGRLVDPAVSYEWAKLLVHAKDYQDATAVVDDLMGRAEQPDAKRIALHLGAKAADRMKDFSRAFDYASRANEYGKLKFEPDLYEEQVSDLMENWSRDAMERFPISSCDSEVPVFVAGMPRSGTSLIDQIIDSHPRAAGVGELDTIERFAAELSVAWDPEKPPPDCFGHFDSYRWTRAARTYLKEVQTLSPGAERIVNKALGNNKLLGLIARLFPSTRIIHAIRDPRDVAISCFMGGFNNKMHAWTTQIDWAVRAWEQSMRMMAHWKASLDVPILDVYYENLVRDPAQEFPRIIEFLGLEWDEACMDFHTSRRTVRTLSYDQVNRPLYTSSVGRHVNYAPFLDGFEFPKYNSA